MKTLPKKITKDVEIVPCSGKWYVHIIGSGKHNVGHLWSEAVARRKAFQLQVEIKFGLVKTK